MEPTIVTFREILANKIAEEIKENTCFDVNTSTKIVEYSLVEDLIQAIVGTDFNEDYSKFHDEICNFVDTMIKRYSK